MWLDAREDEGTATRDVIQIRHFFEAGADTLWITFSAGFLWWCFAKPGVQKHEYLKRKLNGQLLPEVEDAAQAENQMVQKIIPLMRLLTWQDFEMLVDLVFANSGWRRIGQVGKTQKTVDIELLLPTTSERAFVQVKSYARKQDLAEYMERLKSGRAYDRMFFVWHSGDVGEVEETNVSLIGPDRLARMVFDAGLTSWLREKVS